MLSGYKYKSLATRTPKVVQKLHICEKVIFDQLLDFPILLLLFLHSLLVCHILLFESWIFFNTIRVSNSLDPDQARRCVGPDLGPNCSNEAIHILS